MQNWFIQQFDIFFAERGRRLVGWDEISDDPELSPEAAIMWWRAGDSKDSVIRAAQRGHDIVITTHEHLYFDYYQCDETSEPLANGSITSLEKVYHFDSLGSSEFQSVADKVLGAQGQLWREYMPTTEHLQYMAYPRSCALAEVLWLPHVKKDYAYFLKRMKVQEARFDAAGVNYRNMQF